MASYVQDKNSESEKKDLKPYAIKVFFTQQNLSRALKHINNWNLIQKKAVPVIKLDRRQMKIWHQNSLERESSTIA